MSGYKNGRVTDHAAATFLRGLIDDAALFPPARLSMAAALDGHARAAASEAAWVAGRFLVPASRVPELDAVLAARGIASLACAVVVDAARADPAVFAAAMRSAGRARIEAFEVSERSLPGATAGERLAGLRAAVDACAAQVPAYVEVSLANGGDLLTALHRARENGFDVRAKIRCGGLDAAAFPSPKAIAAFVWSANRFAVPFKATAGLHHPLRHEVPEFGATAHGFLNVMGGAVLAHARDLDRATVEELLGERDPAAFELDARRLAWRGIGADAAEIAQARGRFAHGYGSCSFDEPIDDLRALGLLPVAA